MEVIVRPLREEDLPDADRIMRVAFGTFMHMPEPEKFAEGTDHIKTRWLADSNSAFAAEVNGKLVGSSFATRWGSFGFFGPLTVHPDFWDQGVAKKLLEPTMQLFSKWGTSHAALFTFANSPKHLGLYQKFGFWPRYLTSIMSKTVQSSSESGKWSKFSDGPYAEKDRYLSKCRNLSGSVYNGLDLEREILAVQAQKLGETVMVWEGDVLAAFAVCHCGPGTEAGNDTCYIKFATAGRGPDADEAFDKLLNACEEYARMRGVTDVLAGVNTACHNAYRRMILRGFRTDFVGVLMLRPNQTAFDNSDSYVICDLR
jgi:GNAT superfamily N-acetyltransferase